MAFRICELYVKDGSEQQINISSTLMRNILAVQPTDFTNPDLFGAATDEVFKLMDRDTYRRFVKSEIFHDLLSSIRSSCFHLGAHDEGSLCIDHRGDIHVHDSMCRWNDVFHQRDQSILDCAEAKTADKMSLMEPPSDKHRQLPPMAAYEEKDSR